MSNTLRQNPPRGHSSRSQGRHGQGQADAPARAAARRVRPAQARKGGALAATIALLVAGSLAVVSVALATRAFWGSGGSQGKKQEPDETGSSRAAAFAPPSGGQAPAARPARVEPTPPSPPLSEAQAKGAELRLPQDPTIDPERRIYLFDGGKAQVVRDDDARVAAYSIIDLSDDWVPFLFRERSPGQDDYKKNDYRETFVKVANDLADESGEPLPAGEHNYVELFGIPPSLSVVRRRFIEDEQKQCFAALRPGVLEGYRGAVKYEGSQGAREILDRFQELKGQAQKAMKRTGAKSVDQLKQRGDAFLAKQYRLYQTKLAVIHQAQQRLHCEGLYGRGEKLRPMVFDHAMHQALARFERKHKLFGYGQLYGRTLRVLSRPPLANNFATFRRVVTERMVHSVGIIEDGTAPHETPALSGQGGAPRAATGGSSAPRSGRKGKAAPRGLDLVGPFTNQVLVAMDLDTPEKVLEFFKTQPPDLFRRFRVGVKLPPRPDYYSEDMSFEVVIDRGDVWYDPPYFPSGKPRGFPRNNLPSLTLFAVQGERRIPLVRYHTTVGGWRTEYHDGKEYYAYKGSEVGPRLWRDVVAGPVWIPPPTTPPKSLLTHERRDGRWIRRVNREEIGPSYASAYGLVAAYHIEETRAGKRVGWKDNGIRTHGSVDYMSILTRYSHGCHRLHNHLAVRLFSFVLRHSKFVRRGQIPLAFEKRFVVSNQTYSLKLHTRGYYYTLRKPVRVMVTEGRILGQQKTPFEHYLAIPGKTYDKDDPNLKPSVRVESDAKDSQDGYKPSGDLPPEPASSSPPKGEKKPGEGSIEGRGSAGASSGAAGSQGPAGSEGPASGGAPPGKASAGSPRPGTSEGFLRRLDPRTLPPPPKPE